MESTRTIFLNPKESDYKDLLELKTNNEVRKYLGGVISEVDIKRSFEKILSAKKTETYLQFQSFLRTIISASFALLTIII